jgi:hypothetical protein
MYTMRYRASRDESLPSLVTARKLGMDRAIREAGFLISFARIIDRYKLQSSEG